MTEPAEVGLSARQRRARATRTRILDTALRLFSEQGYAATPTRQIAAEARVSEGLIFRYFPTKIDLVRSQAERTATIAGLVATIVAEHGDAPVDELLARLTDAFVGPIGTMAPTMRMLLGESISDPAVHEVFRTVVDRTVDAIATYLGRRVDAGELRPDLPCTVAARSLLSSLLLFLLTDGGLDNEAWKVRARAHADAVVDVWLRGARA